MWIKNYYYYYYYYNILGLSLIGFRSFVRRYHDRTMDYGLWTGYKTWTRVKTRTKHYRLGINTDPGITRGPSIMNSV